MANHCVVCDRRWPPEPVRVLIIGEAWVEFCSECEENEDFLMRPDGSPITLIEAWREAQSEREASLDVF